MRLVVLSLFVLLLAPSVAHAEPITAALAAVSAMQWVMIAITVASAVYGAAQQRRALREAAEAQRNAKAAANAAMKDRTITAVTTDAPHRYIYGEARVGSDIVAIFSSGGRDEIKHLVCIHAAHECEEIGEIYIADKAIGPLDADGYVTSGPFYSTRTDVGGGIWDALSATFELPHTPVAGTFYVGDGGSTMSGGSGDSSPSDWAIYSLPFTLVGRTVTIVGFDPEVMRPTGYSYQHVVALPRVRVKKHLGIPGDAADAYLMAQQPGKWRSTDTLSGFTYTVVMLDQTHPEFQGGIPSIEPVIKGAKLYDPRTGLTAWGENNALVIYHYLTSEICGVDESDLPVAQFIAAANVCDEVESFGALYTFNGAVTAAEDQKQVLEKMAQSMAGGIVSTTWDIWAGKYIAPVMALTQEDIVGSWAITPGVSGSDIYNGVKGQFISDENAYVVTDFTPYQNPDYVAADLREFWTNIDFPYTDTTQRVHNLSRIFIKDQRNGFTIKAEFSLKTWALKIGSRVTMTSAFFGHAGKIFRVTDKKYSPTSMVELTLKEDAAEIWDLADAVTVDATPNTDLPNPFDIDELESLTCESGTDALLAMADGSIVSRILVTWPTVAANKCEIQIERQKHGTEIWQRVTAGSGDTQTYLSPVEDSALYIVRGRVVNPAFGSESDWTYAAMHQVIGKTEPPENYDAFTISIQPDGTRQFEFSYQSIAPPRDLAGPLIRYMQGTAVSPAWDSMTPLNGQSFPYPASPYETNLLLAGQHVFAIRAIDTTGNLAQTPVYIYATLPDRRLGNVIEEFHEHIEGWTGTKTSCQIVDGALNATNAATWGTSSSWATWTRWNRTPAASIIYETPVRDIGTSVTGGINSAVMALGSAAVELRTSADGVTWSAYASASTLFTARYLQARVIVAATTDEPVATILSWIIQIQANVISEIVNDAVISGYTGAHRVGTGDIRIPLANTYGVIKRISVAIQDSTATSWTWAIIDKNVTDGPRLQFRANGILADPALVDFFIEGS